MINSFSMGSDMGFGCGSLVLIAGPCVIENRDSAMRHAEKIKDIADKLGLEYVYKSSYDKANRTSLMSYRGPGIELGLVILQEVKAQFGIPVLTDVHSVAEVPMVAEVADILQIPAFLCRQTDLLTEAGGAGRAVNIKKGQWMAPWDMEHAAVKVRAAGCGSILLTERGVSFGNNDLVVDFRSLPIMRRLGYPVVFDATHSVQAPGSRGTSSGGSPEFIPALARAAVAVGIDGLFMEVHENPVAAKSDAAIQFPLDKLEGLLRHLVVLHEAAKL